MTNEYQRLREKLPGYEHEEIILCDKRKNGHNRILRLKCHVSGCFEDLFFVHNFWVETTSDLGYPDIQTFQHFQDAVRYYAKLE